LKSVLKMVVRRDEMSAGEDKEDFGRRVEALACTILFHVYLNAHKPRYSAWQDECRKDVVAVEAIVGVKEWQRFLEKLDRHEMWKCGDVDGSHKQFCALVEVKVKERDRKNQTVECEFGLYLDPAKVAAQALNAMRKKYDWFDKDFPEDQSPQFSLYVKEGKGFSPVNLETGLDEPSAVAQFYEKVNARGTMDGAAFPLLKVRFVFARPSSFGTTHVLTCACCVADLYGRNCNTSQKA
jgi:hypothetical protein